MAVKFTADGQDYTSTDSPPAGDFTVTWWARLDAVKNWQTFWESSASGSDLILYQTNQTSQQPWMYLADGGTAGNQVRTTSTMTVGTWYRFAATHSGTTHTLYMAVEGSPLTQVAVGTRALTTNILRIGESRYTGEWLQGAMANFKHYSAVLSLAECETELNQYTPARTAGLVRWHSFRTASTADESGNGRTLTGGVGATTAASPASITDGTPAPTGPTWTLWDGTTEQPLTLDGVWNGTSIVPVTVEVA